MPSKPVKVDTIALVNEDGDNEFEVRIDPIYLEEGNENGIGKQMIVGFVPAGTITIQTVSVVRREERISPVPEIDDGEELNEVDLRRPTVPRPKETRL